MIPEDSLVERMRRTKKGGRIQMYPASWHAG
jgi:hypothetical protein